MKNTVYKIIPIAVCVILAASCQKTQYLDFPLAVNSRLVKLSSEAGHTGVMIYCNSSWTSSLTDDNWASLDTDKGSGNSMVNFSYEFNEGSDRRTGIVFQSGELRDTVWMCQKGGNYSLTFIPAKTSLTLPCTANKSSILLSTNMGAGISGVSADIDYYDETDSGWITDVCILETAIKISYSANTSGKERKARITFRIPDTGLVFSNSKITLTQKYE